jgi:hypothetical protein
MSADKFWEGRMNTVEYIQNHVRSGKVIYGIRRPYRMPVPAITCKDGFKVSVQASDMHYCFPRVNNPGQYGYLTFELGYPSREDDRIAQYAEDSTDLTNTVYGNVPAYVVVGLLEDHGGIDTEKTEHDLHEEYKQR